MQLLITNKHKNKKHMKKIFLIAVLGLISMASVAQNKIDLTVKWNPTLSRYEVYAKTNFADPVFKLGPSQITVVVPASAENKKLSITSATPHPTITNGVEWAASDVVYAPAADPQHDFHAIQTEGKDIYLIANTETLLYSFTFPNGQCLDGVRLFVNGSDPKSSASGMNGSDYTNALANGNDGKELYSSNYNNTGTICNPCNITAPELIK